LSFLTSILSDHRTALDALPALEPAINKAAQLCLNAIKNGGKIMICGNGGSAADSQHFSTEIAGRFLKERKGYAALALTTDTSLLTAVGNDYSFDNIFSRQVEALGKPGDVLFGISTSGNSKNIFNAVKLAKESGIETISLLGRNGGTIKDISGVPIVVPSEVTARVQECHIIIIHIICAIMDEELE
jgi:D-sedoheptulose 7-phosphate isomerase